MNQEQAQASQDRSRSMHNIFTGAFSLLLFIGIAVCAICDTAISRSFTWSLYPISAIVFTWLVFIPMIKFGKKGVCGSLLMCSIFIVPFLYVLHRLIRVSDLFFLSASIWLSLELCICGVFSSCSGYFGHGNYWRQE